MIHYIDADKHRFGVEPICRTLQVAPSTYYAAKTRPPCASRRRDEALKPQVERVHRENFGVYGMEKIWRQLTREQIAVGRDRVHRLMRELKAARRGSRQTGVDHHYRIGCGSTRRSGRATLPGEQRYHDQRAAIGVERDERFRRQATPSHFHSMSREGFLVEEARRKMAEGGNLRLWGFICGVGPAFKCPFHGEFVGWLCVRCSEPHASMASEVRIEAGQCAPSPVVCLNLNPKFRSPARCP